MEIHTIPSGFWDMLGLSSYKHKFPSGILNIAMIQKKASYKVVATL
jgi:hypothetical protein